MRSLMPITISALALIMTSCTLPFQSPTVPVVPMSSGVAPISTGVSLLPPAIATLTPFLARGTEPFWAFVQTATGAIYSVPGGLMGGVDEMYYTTIETISGTTIIVAATPIATGSLIQVTLVPGTCSDGMSDIIYPYNATLVLPSETRTGCAN
jgi:uncharacterized membrane protein